MPKRRKAPQAKSVNFTVIPARDEANLVLKAALACHEDLKRAKIALAWRKKVKADVDGHLLLGRCHKVSDLQKEFMAFDFVIVLNKEAWDELDAKQRLALVDHELCHAAPVLDKEGEQKQDERSRYLWRVRKHDIEEFREIVERHGCYKGDLERFAEAIRAKKKEPLFASQQA